MSNHYTHKTYGLIIQSPLPLPELIAAEGEPDVIIRFDKVKREAIALNGGESEIHVVGNETYLAWDHIGYFLVREGREIIIEPLPSVQEHVLRLFVLGTTLAMLLCQRGLAVFHASAVAFGDQVIAFAGIKGAGKSTFAAALHASGYDLVSDDILAIDMGSGLPLVLPGFPHLKLWPDSVALLGHDPQRLPRLRPEVEKRSYSMVQRFTNEPLPLRHFCIISPASAFDLHPYEPLEALAALMPHWYAARFGMEQLRALGLRDFFQQCVGVANSAAIYRLKRPRLMPSVADISHLITENLMQDAQHPRT